MELPSEGLSERLREVDSYLNFLRSMEKATADGPPRLEGAEETITTMQQRILYSSVYMQLYNVVEATVTRCLDFVTIAAMESKKPKPSELSEGLKKEWVRNIARTHVEMGYEKRLENALALCNVLVNKLPAPSFKITSSAGNWDNYEIEKISQRLGCKLIDPQDVLRSTKKPIRDEMGPLALIKDLRNKLAHGQISFAQCGEGVTVDELEHLSKLTASYLKVVTNSFETYVESEDFIRGATPKVAAG